MSKPRGLILQHYVFDLFREARCKITYDEYRDRCESTDMVLRSIPVREFGTPLEIETTCVDTAAKFKYFLSCTRRVWARSRRRRNRPARLYVTLDDIGARGIVLTHAVFDAICAKFAEKDPAPGWIYVLLVSNAGECEWVADPFAYLRELKKQQRRELAPDNRLCGCVQNANGSSYMIRAGAGGGTLFFAFYDRNRGRPDNGDTVSFFPTDRWKRGNRIARAVRVE
jgi:hypothetical protein